VHADEVTRVVDGVASASLEADLDDARDRRHAVRVDEEEHVVAGGSDVRASGKLHFQAARLWAEDEFGEALVLVEGVRDGAEAYHRYLRDAGGIRRRDEEVRIECDLGWGRGDSRPRPLEEVGRRVDFIVRLVDFARSWRKAAPRREYAAVRQQQRGRVIEPPYLHARHRRPRLGVGVVHLRREHCARGLIGAWTARPAGNEELGRQAVASRSTGGRPEGHVANPAPLRRGRDGGGRVGDDRRYVEIDHFALAAR